MVAAAVDLPTEAGLVESSAHLVGVVRLPMPRILKVILDDHLVDQPRPAPERAKVLARLRAPLLAHIDEAVTHSPGQTLYAVAAVCAPQARSADAAAAAWTAGEWLHHTHDDQAGWAELCATALRMHAFNGIVAELFPTAAALLR